MAKWAADDGPVLAAAERLLRQSEHVSENQVLAALGRSADGRREVIRSMKLLIESDYLLGKVGSGDATIQDVMVTGITEKGPPAAGALDRSEPRTRRGADRSSERSRRTG